MTSKEVLKRLYNDASKRIIDEENKQWYHAEIKQDYMFLKQQLERLEKLEDNIKIHKETIKMQYSQIESLQSENTKLKKIIEIIRTKIIVLVALKLSKDLDDYNRMTNFDNLTQEEYELLKEYFYDKYKNVRKIIRNDNRE